MIPHPNLFSLILLSFFSYVKQQGAVFFNFFFLFLEFFLFVEIIEFILYGYI